MSESFAQQYGPWALIAGGSEGIGLSFAHQLAAAGLNLVLLARNETALDAARESILTSFPAVVVRTHTIDLTNAGLSSHIEEITNGLEIGLLIYNAGAMHGAELFLDAPEATAHQLIALNCSGPVAFCHQLGSAMRQRGRGGIILMSSMSGLAGGAYVASYAATKSFDITFAEGLWAELKPFGVNVLGLIAGATDTPAMARSGIRFDPDGQYSPMEAEDVAREALAHLAAGPLHVAGKGNQRLAALLRGDRHQAIEMMSMGAAAMYNRSYPPVATKDTSD